MAEFWDALIRNDNSRSSEQASRRGVGLQSNQTGRLRRHEAAFRCAEREGLNRRRVAWWRTLNFRPWRLLLWLVSCSILPLTGVLLLGFSTGPLPALTGGFQEPTCNICHDNFAVNEGRTLGGTFQIEGIPSNYRAGETYPLRVTLGQPGQQRWGFELSARLAHTGRQAGRLIPVDGMTQTIESAGIQYIQHTAEGTRLGTRDGPVEFNFNWVAPETAGGPVLFNAAGNAADASGDPTGDYIFTAGGYSADPVSGIEWAGRDAPPAAVTAPRALQRLNVSPVLINLPVPASTRKGNWEIHIEHRFLQPIAQSRPGTGFGIDAGANINLGMSYSPLDNLTVGVSRTRFDQIIQFTGSYQLLNREDLPWKVALHGGIEGQRNFRRQYSPYFQLTNSFDTGKLRTYAVPTLILNSRDEAPLELVPDRPAVNPECNNTFSLGLGADLALNRRFSLNVEVVPRLAGFGGLGDPHTTVSSGVQLRTWGHVFTILVSNSREFTPSKYGVNAGSRDFFLGFNIYRRR